MAEINKVCDLVERLMEQDARTRNSDDYLFMRVCSVINPSIENASFQYVMENRGSMKLPAYETVSRCRRKVQHNRTELCAVADVEAGREVRRGSFKNFALKSHL